MEFTAKPLLTLRFHDFRRFEGEMVGMDREITPPLATPTSCCSFEYLSGSSRSALDSALTIGPGNGSFEIQKRRLFREIDEMVCIYDDCFRRLQLVIDEIDHMRDENLCLAAENLEVTFLIEQLEADSTGAIEESDQPLAKSEDRHEVKGEVAATATAAISGAGKGEGSSGTPKSISIRSSGFLAVKSSPPIGRKVAGEAKRSHRLRLPLSPVNGGEGEGGDGEVAVEVEVYDQGTAKTELCNKWGEMEWCPYGSRCQFAHGLVELRPVIRHPRYKTQLCRMLSSPDGSGCPYGHRCHFRHSLPKSH